VPLGYPRAEVVHVEASRDAPAAIAERFPVRLGSRSGMAIGLGSIWLAAGSGPVRRLDPATGRITATVRLGSGPKAMVVGHDAAWISNSDEDSVTRIDPRTNSVVRSISVGSDPVSVAVSPDAVWVAKQRRRHGLAHRSRDERARRNDSCWSSTACVATAEGLVWVTVRS
jgi:YVTN family beta-propeller protein